jgi:hypothetical protein
MSETSPPGRGEGAETWPLSAEVVRPFLGQRTSAPEERVVLRHLLTGCLEWFALTSRITAEVGYWTRDPGADPHVDLDYAAAFLGPASPTVALIECTVAPTAAAPKRIGERREATLDHPGLLSSYRVAAFSDGFAT